MIIQCDQCNTKFNLDDAKVPDKGIKVRCAKCKHVFMVQKEVSSEEPDLDFLLSGLGAQAPEEGQGTLPADAGASLAAQGEEWQMPAQGLGAGSAEGVEPPAKVVEDQAPTGDLGEDFFAAKEEPTVRQQGGYEYGEFAFEEEEAKAPEEPAASAPAAAGSGEFEFGEFPFEAENAVQSDAQPPVQELPREPGEFDFGSRDFAVDELSPAKVDEAGAAAAEFTDAGFSFGEEEAARDESPEVEVKTDSTTESVDTFDFGEIALPADEEKETQIVPPSLPPEVEKEAAHEPLDISGADFAEAKDGEPAAAKDEAGEVKFDFAPEPVVEPAAKPPFVPPMPSVEDDELPPLAIATRKKGRSIFSVAITAIVVLIVLAIAGAGFYVFKAGPTAFNKLGLSFLAKWVGMEVAEEGGITIRNPQGSFMVNREAGEIFVVSGEAVNNFKKPRASIQVKATILGSKGEILAQKSAYCGNYISKEQLAALPMSKIEEAMGSPFGDSLANLGVQPGKGIPFIVVFSGVPKSAAEFSAEVVGSTVAGQ